MLRAPKQTSAETHFEFIRHRTGRYLTRQMAETPEQPPAKVEKLTNAERLNT
jgi:hypothetical protein